MTPQKHRVSGCGPTRDSDTSSLPILKEGRNCWRIARAERLCVLIDMEDYYRAAREAILKARRSVLLIGWTFDPRTQLLRGDKQSEAGNAISEVLEQAAGSRPGLDVRVLIWNMPLPYSARNDLFPQRATRWFDDATVKYRLDPCEHTGASHHQKILVIDDTVAFCGGGDFVNGRWDTAEHLDEDPRRTDPSGEGYPPRHEVMVATAGPVAAALGELARERWFRATGERLKSPAPVPVEDAWPESCEVELTDTQVAISRTVCASAGRAAVRESEALFLDSIADARELIFLENQYFSAPEIGAALAKRLEDPDGPEVVVVCTHRSPGFLDGLCMDAARDELIARLRQSDRYNRFRVYSPRTRGGADIIVHSKVSIIDDRLLRIGSCNIANRSMGFDTECDIAIAAPEGEAGRREQSFIRSFRDRLVSHYLGSGRENVAGAVHRSGSLGAAIEALDGQTTRRLPPLEARRLGPFGRLIARYHLGDPEGAADAWRPWRRRSMADLFDTLSSRRSTTRGR